MIGINVCRIIYDSLSTHFCGRPCSKGTWSGDMNVLFDILTLETFNEYDHQ